MLLFLLQLYTFQTLWAFGFDLKCDLLLRHENNPLFELQSVYIYIDGVAIESKGLSTDILIEFLEVIFNGILYQRKIYPIEIFQKKKIYGTAVWISEHPEVNEYFKNVLEAIKEALIFDSASIKRINLVIFNENNVFIEKFVVDLLKIKIDSTVSDPYFLKTEESLRTICLKLSMIDHYLKPIPEASKFVVEIETHEAAHVNLSENPKCEDFPWIVKNNGNYEDSTKNSLLPIYTVKTEFLGLQLFVVGDSRS